MPSITPFLWFDDDAEEAIALYTSLFPEAEVTDERRSPDGALFLATFRLAGQSFMALNGGPHFAFTEAISLYVSVQTQSEIDHLWAALTSGGGTPSQCGWLKDRFGLSWQIVPEILGELLADPDPAKAGATQQAMLAMTKIDIAALRAAHTAA